MSTNFRYSTDTTIVTKCSQLARGPICQDNPFAPGCLPAACQQAILLMKARAFEKSKRSQMSNEELLRCNELLSGILLSAAAVGRCGGQKSCASGAAMAVCSNSQCSNARRRCGRVRVVEPSLPTISLNTSSDV